MIVAYLLARHSIHVRLVWSCSRHVFGATLTIHTIFAISRQPLICITCMSQFVMVEAQAFFSWPLTGMVECPADIAASRQAITVNGYQSSILM